MVHKRKKAIVALFQTITQKIVPYGMTTNHYKQYYRSIKSFVELC